MSCSGWFGAGDFRFCKKAREERDRCYRDGMIAMVRGDLGESERQFKRALKLDPWDVDAMLQLGTVYKSQGQTRRARRMFKRCRSRDLQNKWQAEIQREFADL